MLRRSAATTMRRATGFVATATASMPLVSGNTTPASHSFSSGSSSPLCFSAPPVPLVVMARRHQSTSGAPPGEQPVNSACGKLQRFHYPDVSLAVPEGWTVQENGGPTSAILDFRNPAFGAEPQELAHAEPMLKLSVEDLTGSGIDMTKLVPISRGKSIQELEGMTEGAIKPKVLVDEAVSVGNFEHCLRYTLENADDSLHLLSLVTMKDGLVYNLQLCRLSSTSERYEDVFYDIAKSLVPESKPVPAFDPKEGSSITVTTDRLKISVPAAWMPVRLDEGDTDPHLAFRTPSVIGEELVLVYLPEDCKGAETLGGRTVEVQDVEHPYKAVANGTYAIRCVAATPKSAVVTSGETLEAVLASITPSSAAAPPVYRNVQKGYEFALAPQYKLYESRLGNGRVDYAPNADPEPGPIGGEWLSIGVHDAAVGEIGSTADECYAKLKAELGQEQDIKKVRVGENDFVVAKQIGKDFTGGSHFFFSNGKVMNVLWGTPDWKRLESSFDAIAASLKLW